MLPIVWSVVGGACEPGRASQPLYSEVRRFGLVRK